MRKEKNIFFFKRYINGTKGVISLFLALLMTPFLTIVGMLINLGRLNSTVAIFDEALCNASNSALGTYDEFLRSRFGLMAMSQDPEKAAAQLGVSAVEYTGEDFVQDLFVYYMEQNLGSLSNAYDESSIGATGIYPLGDTKVLRSSILQASKITVPAEMVVEWSSLEDLMSMLTKPFDLFASIEDTLAGGADVVNSIEELTDSQEDLEKQIDACNTARSEYTNAYNEFSTAVSNYNTLVGNINASQATVNTCQQEFDRLDSLVSGINDSINTKEAKVKDLKKDKNQDHSAEIQTLEEEIEQLKTDREEAAPGYEQAEEDLSAAKRTLKNYQDQYSGKQRTVTDKKTNYYNKIVALQEEIDATWEMAEAFNNAAEDLVTNATGFVSSAAETGLDIAKESCKKQNKQLKEENKQYGEKLLDAQTSTDKKAEEYYKKRIEENNAAMQKNDENKRKYGNSSEVASGAIDTFNDVYSGLSTFADRDLKKEYSDIYSALDTCRVNVNNIVVPTGYSKVSYTKSDVYVTVSNPIEKSEISEIISNIEEQIKNNAGWAILKAIFGFFDALTNLSLWHDPDLNANINASLYSANGGLPSKISRTAYPVTNPYADQDAAQALEYKKELNTYSAEDVYEIPENGGSIADTINGYIDTIQNTPFKLKNIRKLWNAAKGLFNSLGSLGKSIVKDGATSLLKGRRDSIYLVGYASYYTANRTTYTGKALTGASFDLPLKGEDDGYVFNGAELEYIFEGDLSEKENQQAAFNAIWVERMLWNLPAVLSDSLAQSLANALGAVLPVVGQLLVYVAFLAAEGYVDTVILANGGDIPMIKSCIYLSPTGMPKLIEEIFSLSLSPEKMEGLYNKSKDAATKINNDTNKLATNKNANFTNKTEVSYPDYKEAKDKQEAADKENKIRDTFRMDYTKSMQVYMLLFGNNEKYVKRIADIIQMEASYKAKKEDITAYNFNLDKSYTYIRAFGSFTSGVFMKIGEDESYTSKNRVVYNGY